MATIKKILVYPICKPLKIPFATSLGKKTFIKSVLVKTILNNNYYGIGEIPTSFAIKHETVNVIQEVLQQIIPKIVNTNIEYYQEIISYLRKKFEYTPMTLSGLETSLFRAYLSSINTNEYSFWQQFFNHKKTKSLSMIETDITIPYIKNFNILNKWLIWCINSGFKIFKLKLSGNLDFDTQLISFVYTTLYTFFGTKKNFIIRLDANQAYNKNSFLSLLKFVEKNNYKIQLFEQPLKKNDFSGLKYIKQYSYIPIILDETVFTKNDLMFVIKESLADGVNIKIAKSGILQSTEILLTAKKNKMLTMFGCMTETMVGLSTSIYIALSSGMFDFIDLDSIFFLFHKNVYSDIKLKPPNFVIIKK